MTTTFGPGIAAPGNAPSLERQQRAERETEDETWSLMITQALVAQAPRLTLGTLGALAATPPGAAADDAPPDTAAGSPALADGDADGAATASASDARTRPHGVPEQLTTELLDARLGRIELVVARGARGLSIVINVADVHVKALIMSERQDLLQSLRGCGLSVTSVQIGTTATTGTALAPDREGPDRTRKGGSLPRSRFRAQAYLAPPEEEDAETERVDFTV
jgi:hypothetical protein